MEAFFVNFYCLILFAATIVGTLLYFSNKYNCAHPDKMCDDFNKEIGNNDGSWQHLEYITKEDLTRVFPLIIDRETKAALFNAEVIFGDNLSREIKVYDVRQSKDRLHLSFKSNNQGVSLNCEQSTYLDRRVTDALFVLYRMLYKLYER